MSAIKIFVAIILCSAFIGLIAGLNGDNSRSSSSYTSQTKSKPKRTVPDEISAIVAAKNLIEDELKAPGSAKHPGWTYEPHVTKITNMKWEVVSYVDAQNSYGAMLRMNYAMEIEFYYNEKDELMAKKVRSQTW
jgi:hypothetical protein